MQMDASKIGPYEELSATEQAMIDEGCTDQEILAARVQRFYDIMAPHVRITISARMPGNETYQVVLDQAQNFMTEDEVFDLLNTARRFHQNILNCRERRQKRMEAGKCPKSIIDAHRPLISRSRRKVNMLNALCGHRDNPFLKKLEQFALFLFWRKEDSVELKKAELDAMEAKGEYD